jgi:hypothetical protein
MLAIQRLMELAGQLAEGHEERIIAIWHELEPDASRSTLTQGILQGRGDRKIIPIVVDDGRFRNANALLRDLKEVLVENRETFEGAWYRGLPTDTPCILLLLAREELGFPQQCSPVGMPAWFPGLGGLEISIRVLSLNESATTSLKAPEASVESIQRLLYELDKLLLRRLKNVYEGNPKHANAFGDRIKTLSKEAAEDAISESAADLGKYRDFLQSAEAHFQTTFRTGEGYRPSMKVATPVGILVAFGYRTSVDDMKGLAEAFASALRITDGPSPSFEESIISVVWRSTNFSGETQATRMGRTILTTIFSAAQFINATAHAPEYPEFPLVIIRSLSFDLRRSLRSIINELEALPDLPKRVIPPTVGSNP